MERKLMILRGRETDRSEERDPALAETVRR